MPEKTNKKGTDPGPVARLGLDPLLQLSIARIKEFYREPEAIFWVFVFPVLLALALGIAFRSRPPEVLEVAVDKGLEKSEDIASFLAKSEYVDPKIMSEDEADEKLRAGEVALFIGRPVDEKQAHAATGKKGDRPAYSLRFDPGRPQSRMARLATGNALQECMGRRDVAGFQEVLVKESGSRYIDFLIPGLIGLNLLASSMWGVGFNIVDARTRKLLKLYTAMPMRRSHFLLAFILSRLVYLTLEVILLVSFAWLVFGVEVHGSIVSLAAVLLIAAVSFGGVGLLVAARPHTIEAVSGWINLVMLPMWILSGTFFSYSRFPEVMHPFIRLLPLTAFNDATRAIMSSGLPVMSQLPEIATMIVWGAVCFWVALKVFRWQ